LATALVTGVNGFVGSHLAELLLERGWHVRGLVRRTSDLRWIPRSGVELEYGEVTDPDSLGRAVEGVDVVFHLAGVVRARSEADYLRVNAGGTANVARAAVSAASRPRRMVLLSSLAAAGPSRIDRSRQEDDPDSPLDAYGRSKLAGERELVAAAAGVPWTVVRAPAVYGPRDRGFLVLARMSARGWVPRIGGRRQPISIVHVRDLSRGMLAAADFGSAAGRTYYVTHPEPTNWEELGRRMAGVLGRRARALPVPGCLVHAVGRAAGIAAAAAGKANPLPPDRLGALLAPAWTCDGSRARAELGFRAEVGTGDGLRETVTWYRREGWL
jgi:dihydroflavonol-4-reductase